MDSPGAVHYNDQQEDRPKNVFLKMNGSGWKFALLFLAGLLIAAQLIFLIHWRWENDHRRDDVHPKPKSNHPHQHWGDYMDEHDEQQQQQQQQTDGESFLPGADANTKLDGERRDGPSTIDDSANKINDWLPSTHIAQWNSANSNTSENGPDQGTNDEGNRYVGEKQSNQGRQHPFYYGNGDNNTNDLLLGVGEGGKKSPSPVVLVIGGHRDPDPQLRQQEDEPSTKTTTTTSEPQPQQQQQKIAPSETGTAFSSPFPLAYTESDAAIGAAGDTDGSGAHRRRSFGDWLWSLLFGGSASRNGSSNTETVERPNDSMKTNNSNEGTDTTGDRKSGTGIIDGRNSDGNLIYKFFESSVSVTVPPGGGQSGGPAGRGTTTAPTGGDRTEIAPSNGSASNSQTILVANYSATSTNIASLGDDQRLTGKEESQNKIAESGSRRQQTKGAGRPNPSGQTGLSDESFIQELVCPRRSRISLADSSEFKSATTGSGETRKLSSSLKGGEIGDNGQPIIGSSSSKGISSTKMDGDQTHHTHRWKLAQPIESLLAERSREVAQCFVVMDARSQYGSGYARSISREPRLDVLLAEADLDFSENVPFIRQTARAAPVKTDSVNIDYQKLIVSQPFIVGTFPPAALYEQTSYGPPEAFSQPQGSKHRVLCLGLHGSTVNNFFAQLSTDYDVTVIEPEPALRYIAKKWFGFHPNDRHRVIIQNPAHFVRRMAHALEKPEEFGRRDDPPKKYDLIVVDVCNDESIIVMCPKTEFVDAETVANLRKLLNENGTFVMNIYSPYSSQPAKTDADIMKKQQLVVYKREVLNLYLANFANCYYVEIGSNSVLTCVPGKPTRMSPHNYAMATRKLPTKLYTFENQAGPKVFINIGLDGANDF